MISVDPGLLLLAATAAIAWAWAGSARLPGVRVQAVVRGLLGGGAAFGLAVSAYGLLEIAGLDLRWEQVLGGGWPALGAALLIGLVEEGAKLGGLVLAARQASRPAALMSTAVGTCAAFAALETVAVLSGGPTHLAVARALLAPAAHALLSVPLAFGVALAARRGRRVGLVVVPATLAVSALLHAGGDLALAVPRYGRLGFAVALLAPVLALFFHLRRGGPVQAPAPLAPLALPVPVPVRKEGPTPAGRP